MIKKIVLHLGIHKTATTSTQQFLQKKRALLRQLGVAFVPLPRMRRKISPLIRSSKPADRKNLHKLVSRSKASVMLWSDENLIGSTKNIKDGELYPYVFRRLKRLCASFPEIPIEVVVCIRSPEAFLLSSYSEFIRHNGFESFESYIENFDVENLSFARVLSWASDLPDDVSITILPFEDEFGGGISLVTETILNKACGLDHNITLEDFPKTKSRSAFSAEEIEVGRVIAEASSPETARDFFRLIDAKGHRFGKTKFNPLAPDVRTKLLHNYKADLEHLCGFKSTISAAR